MEVCQELNRTDWENYIIQHPQGNIFLTPEMYQVFLQTKGYEPELWAVKSTEGKILALFMPVRITLYKSIKFLTTRAISFGGILVNSDEDGQSAAVLLAKTYNRYSRRKCLFTEIRHINNPQVYRSYLEENNFEYEDHLNYLINLDRSKEDMFLGIKSRTRKQIRRAIKRDEVQIKEIVDLHQLTQSYSLLEKTYKRSKVPLADISLFQSALEILLPKKMIRVIFAEVANKMVAVSFELAFKDRVYGWYGGLDRSFGSYYPNELLMWNILQWGVDNKMEIYDFGGAGKPNEKYGVRDFKAKFGGDLVCYGRHKSIHAPLTLMLSQVGYQTLRIFRAFT